MNEHAKAVLLSNFAPSEYFRSGSFLDILHEQGRWDEDAFWQMDQALRALYRPGEIAGGDQQLVWPVFRIYSALNVLLRSHNSARNGFRIRNMDQDLFSEWCERLQLTFEGFMKGDMLENDMFELTNPLID